MDVTIPDNYGSFEELSNWLRKRMPHEVHRLERWQIVMRPRDGWVIWFRNPADATLFTLLSQ